MEGREEKVRGPVQEASPSPVQDSQSSEATEQRTLSANKFKDTSQKSRSWVSRLDEAIGFQQNR